MPGDALRWPVEYRLLQTCVQESFSLRANGPGSEIRSGALSVERLATGGRGMRAFLIMGATLALAACGGGNDTSSTEANTMAADNMMMDTNMAMDPAMNGGNMAMDPMMNGTMNGVDPATQNMIQQDMNTNSPDTNLANGM
jgi:hypothetical protein